MPRKGFKGGAARPGRFFSGAQGALVFGKTKIQGLAAKNTAGSMLIFCDGMLPHGRLPDFIGQPSQRMAGPPVAAI